MYYIQAVTEYVKEYSQLWVSTDDLDSSFGHIKKACASFVCASADCLPVSPTLPYASAICAWVMYMWCKIL